MRPLNMHALVGLASLAIPGCTTGTPVTMEEPPPLVCKTPEAPASPRFTDVTAEVGLVPSAALTPLATLIQAGDLDGDGYPEILATVGSAERDRADKRLHFVLLNRPSPDDPSGARRVFLDGTEASGILATRDGAGGRAYGPANLGDLDGDGDLDVVTCAGSDTAPDPCAALLNDGAGHFTLAPQSDLDVDGPYLAASSALLDYDRDGLLDYWPATYGTLPLLLRGAGDGTFRYVGDRAGLPTNGGDPALHESYRRVFGVTACDLDGDADQDVLIASYGREANQVWRNDGGTFTEIGQMLGVAFDDRVDFSDDLSYRCYCAANPGACPMGVPAPQATCSTPCNPARERCWFPGDSDQPYRLGGNTFSITCGDVDDDGDMDLMTAEIRHWDVGSSSDPSELLINETPAGSPLMKFTRPGNMATGLVRPEKGGWNQGDMSPVFADVDLDGRKDIYLTTSDYPDSSNHGWLWRQKDDGTFEDVTARSGAGHPQIHGIALIDYDRDGDLDLIAGTSTARGVAPANTLKVYRNEAGQDSNWIQVRLMGAGMGKSNVSAIGARVRVNAGGRTQTKEVSGGYGHTTMQHDLVLTFGLGAACNVDSMEVRWPDAAGSTSTFRDIRPNYRVEIRQGEDGVRYLR